jgi:hypothetical protein
MKRFFQRSPDPVLYVASAVGGYHYYTPDVAAVDGHLVELRGQLVGLGGIARALAKRDIDSLLDRRVFLLLVGEPLTRSELSHLAAQDRRLIA